MSGDGKRRRGKRGAVPKADPLAEYQTDFLSADSSSGTAPTKRGKHGRGERPARSDGADPLGDALERVEANANAAWKLAARQAVWDVAVVLAEFTADDVWDLLDESAPTAATGDPRAMGPIMTRAGKVGWCEATNRSAKSRRQLHKGDVRVWESRVLGETEPRERAVMDDDPEGEE